MYRFLVSFTFLLFSYVTFSQNPETRPEIWAVKVKNESLKNLYKLNDSIYRCEQPDYSGFATLDSLGIKSILNLRSWQSDKPYSDKSSIKLHHVKMKAKNIEDQDVIEALKILVHSPKPVVVHCKFGSDRTGVIMAMYRIIFQNWTKEQAIQELRNGAYGFHEIFKNIPEYIQNCEPDELKKLILN